jgi:hypothetical protein
MSELRPRHESPSPLEVDETEEAFAGFLGALGLLPPETLRNPDSWLALSNTDSLQSGVGNLARVPLLTERWN